MPLAAVKLSQDDPPYPADTQANGWHPELHIDRILTSDTWVLAAEDERPWLLRIWFECWRSCPAGSMPADRLLFARRIGCTQQFLAAHAEILLRGWILHSDGRLYHGFIASQVITMLDRRRSAAKKVRDWREKKKAEEQEECNRLRTGNLPVSYRQEQEQEQEQEQDSKTPQPPTGAKTARRAAKPTADDVIPPGVDPVAWQDFAAHRREIHKPLTSLSARKSADILRALSPDRQREAVNASISNRWTGVFAPKTNGKASPGTVSADAFHAMIAKGQI